MKQRILENGRRRCTPISRQREALAKSGKIRALERRYVQRNPIDVELFQREKIEFATTALSSVKQTLFHIFMRFF